MLSTVPVISSRFLVPIRHFFLSCKHRDNNCIAYIGANTHIIDKHIKNKVNNESYCSCRKKTPYRIPLTHSSQPDVWVQIYGAIIYSEDVYYIQRKGNSKSYYTLCTSLQCFCGTVVVRVVLAYSCNLHRQGIDMTPHITVNETDARRHN